MQSEETKALICQLSQELKAGNLAILDAHPGLAEIRPRIVQELAAGHSIRISEIVVEGEWVMTKCLKCLVCLELWMERL